MKARVMVELNATSFLDTSDLDEIAEHFNNTGFVLDHSYPPVEMGENNKSNNKKTLIVYGTVKTAHALKILEAHDGVVSVWPDTPIAPFNDESTDVSDDFSVDSDMNTNTGNQD